MFVRIKKVIWFTKSQARWVGIRKGKNTIEGFLYANILHFSMKGLNNLGQDIMLIISQAMLHDIFQICWVFLHVLILFVETDHQNLIFLKREIRQN